MKHRIGIYEKATPANISWRERLELARECDFDFVEMSVDETDNRLSRLDWSKEKRLELVKDIIETGVQIPSMCLSAHRRFPFGSLDPEKRAKAKEILQKAVEFCVDTGIRTIQLAGYDVYYENQTPETIQFFQEGLEWAVELAANHQVTIAVEIMDTEFMSSITRWNKYNEIINSPWFTVYPDIGNLSAWGNDIEKELTLGIGKISAIHLKDTLAVTPTFKGQFRDIPFGEGCVDFVEFFKIIKKLKYKGAFLIEMWTEKDSDPKQEIINAKKWIEEKMHQGGIL